jgi:hypothetical protein
LIDDHELTALETLAFKASGISWKLDREASASEFVVAFADGEVRFRDCSP